MKQGLFILALALAALTTTHAVVLDLTDPGDTQVINGAIFQQFEIQTGGQGVIDPFLKVGRNGDLGEGFNTSAASVYADTVVTPTRDVTLGTLGLSADDSALVLTLDINQTGGAPELSLLDLMIYVRDTPVTPSGPGGTMLLTDLQNPGSLLIYDLDGAGEVQLNMINSLGSGSTDVRVLLPVELFANKGLQSNDYFYLYHRMGSPGEAPVFANNDGQEEWASLKVGPGVNPLIPGDDPVIPEPTTALFGAALLGVISSTRLRRAIRIANGHPSA